AGGPPLVQLIDPGTGAVQTQFLAFDPSFYGGVRVAVGDVTGDGYPDLVVAAGRGGGPRVEVDAGRAGDGVGSFFAYDPSFTGGVYTAVGDVTGSGTPDIVTGPGPGGGPQVGVFAPDGRSVASFFAYDPSFSGGVRVAAADLTGDGVAEVITGPGKGSGPQVNVYSLPSTTPLAGFWGLSATQSVR